LSTRSQRALRDQYPGSRTGTRLPAKNAEQIAQALDEITVVDVAPLCALARGGKFVGLRDSLFATNETAGSDVTHQNSSANHAAFASEGKLWYPTNAAVAGNTAAQMLTRFDTDVLPASLTST
jgi:hypothetical protein